MRRNWKKIFNTFAVGVAIGIIIMQVLAMINTKIHESYPVLYKVRISNEFINVRKQPNTHGGLLTSVSEGETYSVVDYYEEENGVFKWYRILYKKNKLGWIASSKDNPWVDEISGNEVIEIKPEEEE